MPLVRPVTVHERAVIGSLEDRKNRVQLAPLLLEYLTRYSVIAEPPVLAGAAHVTANWVLTLTATTDVGALGTVAGMQGAELADRGLMPTAFRAMTLITCAVPLVRPVTVHERAVIGEPGIYRVHDPAAPLLLEYFTRYSVIFEPPLLAGATHVTARLVLPLTATTDVGLLGTVAGVAGAEVAVTFDEPPVYPALVVVIVAVELVPGATPVTVTKPVLLLIATVPDAVAVPAHV